MRRVSIKLLPDQSGRVRIHYFVRDANGPVKTPQKTTMTALGPVRLGGAQGRIACQPQIQSVTPQMSQGAWQPLCHSDDVRAVTCPECQDTDDCRSAQKAVDELVRSDRRNRPKKGE